MPMGTGTYGSKKGRPSEEDKKKPFSFKKLNKEEQDTVSEASEMFKKKNKKKDKGTKPDKEQKKK